MTKQKQQIQVYLKDGLDSWFELVNNFWWNGKRYEESYPWNTLWQEGKRDKREERLIR